MRMKRLLTILCIPAVLLLGAAEASGADLQKGVEAYEAGDYAAALREFRPLAEDGFLSQGDAEAQFFLGQMYRQGRGVTQDYAQAVEWYRKAAEQGYAKAQYNLGFMYSKGRGVAQDDAQALAWTRKAAAQGLAMAQFNLGIRYDQGRGVPKDDVQAYMWFNLAAAQGDEDGAKWRDKVADKMTPGQVAEAQRLASEWVEKHQ